MRSNIYSIREFSDVYQDDIAHLLSIIQSRCQDGGYVIYDKQNLFKQVVEYIYQASDRKRFKPI
jgi:hypothetical protein